MKSSPCRNEKTNEEETRGTPGIIHGAEMFALQSAYLG
jgi:hypothetical protein